MTVTNHTPKRLDRTTVGGIDYDTFMPAANAGGDSFDNNGQQFIVVENGDSGSHTLTVVSGTRDSAKVDGITPPSRTYAVAAGKKRLIGPFPVADYNDATDRVQMTWSAVTAMKIGVFTLVPE